MSQLIVLVRHGQSGANVRHILSDYKDRFPLTPLGRRQARKTAKELKKLRIDALFSSPVLRARQTAGIIGEETSMPVNIDKKLWERRMGKLNGTKAMDGMYLFEKGAKYESMGSVYERTVDFINDQDCNVLVAVAHMVQQQSIAYHHYGFDSLTGFPFKPSYATMMVLEKMGRKLRVLATGFPELNKRLLGKIPKKFHSMV